MVGSAPEGSLVEEDVRRLLEKVAAGDRTAFRWLYRRFQKPLHAYLTRLVRLPQIADELMNETMLEMWRSAGRFGGRSAVSTWLYGIARHKAIDHLRRRRDIPLDEEMASQLPDPSPNPEESVGHSVMADLIGRQMDRLSVEHREVLHLAYRDDMSVEEIAELIGCPANTVKTRMFYARKRMKEFLAEAGIEEP